MACKSFIKRHEKTITKIITWTFLLSCLSGFIYQGIGCFIKYLECPEGIDISIKHQTEVDFPSITFVPVEYEAETGNPLAYNFTKLSECDITLSYENDYISRNPANHCHELKNLWENMTPKLEDFAVDQISIEFMDNTIQKLGFEESKHLWREIRSFMRGVCYTLTLTEEMRKKGIYFLRFYVRHDRHFEMLIHPPGLFLPMDPLQTLDYGYREIQRDQSYTFKVVYRQSKALEFGESKCQTDKTYDFLSRIQDRVTQESLEQLGCTTPFGNSFEKICTDPENASEAMKIYKRENINSTSLYPCSYLSNIEVSVIHWNDSKTYREVIFFFKRYIQMNTSKCTFSGLDLFAALGGYVGLFLGVSIFNIRDGIACIIRRLTK